MWQRLKGELRVFFRLALLCGFLFLATRAYFHGKADLAKIKEFARAPVAFFSGSDENEEEPYVPPPIRVDSAPKYAGSADYKPIPVTPLEEVLRFDWTPAEIAEKWPRVSAAMPELDLQGYRTPILTGHELDDFAGSMTFYFDTFGTLRKITFSGTTGDFRKLSDHLRTCYNFTEQQTNTPGVYLFEQAPKDLSRRALQRFEVKSYLWIRPAQILVEDKPMSRFDLKLVLERPSE